MLKSKSLSDDLKFVYTVHVIRDLKTEVIHPL